MTERRGPSSQEHNEQSTTDVSATGGALETSESAIPAEEASIPDVPDYAKSEVARKREDIRAWLAGALTGLFVAEVIATFLVALLAGGQAWGQVQELFQDTFTALVGLVGSVVGFYFGSQRP